MGEAPRAYTSKVAVPLPTADDLSSDALQLVHQAHDINVSWALAGTADMFPGAAGLVSAVFQAKDIDPKVRELIILRSAYLLDCPYEWQANETMARNTGATDAEITAVTVDGAVVGLGPEIDLVLQATDELTKTGTLEDATLSAMLSAFEATKTRKYVLIIAWFNLLSRFLNGCRVPLETSDKLGSSTSPLG